MMTTLLRRSLRYLAFAGVAVSVAMTAQAGGRDSAVPLNVRTQQGEVQGSIVNGVRRFAGLRYAAPPVGNLRWRPPQAPASFSGVQQATAFGSQCPQTAGSAFVGNEDCLFLNVYTPAQMHRGARLPVMMWIHGGSFVSGAGGNYDPTPLVEGGNVIVVTINYRLGLLAGLALSELDAEAPKLGSGSYGVQDTQQAMRWIQQNIEAFGGDERRVTIFGESSGARHVCFNMISPTAKGLFGNAIAESSCGTDGQPLASAEQFGTSVAAAVGCAQPGAPVDLACMRSKTFQQITLGAVAASGGSPTGIQLGSIPAYGSGVIPKKQIDAARSGQYNRVPLIIGTNGNEGILFVALGAAGPVTDDPAGYLSALQRYTSTTGVPPATIAAEYPLSNYANVREAVAAAMTDGVYVCPLSAMASAFSKRSLVFQYEFTDPNPPPVVPGLNVGPTHGSEMQYLFNMPGTALLTPEQKELSQTMIDYWTTFARTRQPNSFDQPLWPPLLQGHPVLQNLAPNDVRFRSVNDFIAGHHCDFWASHTGL